MRDGEISLLERQEAENAKMETRKESIKKLSKKEKERYEKVCRILDSLNEREEEFYPGEYSSIEEDLLLPANS